jgi:hypothetical protein
VSFFVCLFVCVDGGIRKILTLDNLKKRNVIVVDWCCMCKNSGESRVQFSICLVLIGLYLEG